MREPLDVAACLRLLKRRVRHHDFCPLLVWRGNHCACGATKLNEMHRALASALPGMAKADALVRSLAAGNCCGGYGGPWAADTCLGMQEWALTDPPRLGDPLRSDLKNDDEMCTRCQALKIVRAAQPEETSADAN